MITPINFEYKAFNFPVGEKHLLITKANTASVSILFEFEQNEDIIELLLVCDALQRVRVRLSELIVPYVPFGRQDRVAQHGEPLSLAVFARLLNSCNAQRVIITDPHSDVTTALIDNVHVITQADLFGGFIRKNFPKSYLVSPDAGAQKKIYQVAEVAESAGIVLCSKHRDVKTGKITKTVIHADNLNGQTCVIVDDICDGGRTFIELGNALKAKGAGTVVLCVSHGFFTKGLAVFNGSIDRIYTPKGMLK